MEVIISALNAHEFISPVVVDGETKARGLIPRDRAKYPAGSLMHAKPFDLGIIPRSEVQPRLQDQIGRKAQLSNVRNKGMNGQPIPSRDQNGRGYCWAHSSTSAALLVRALNGQPYADLSAYAVACIIKNYRDEGGWGAESLEFIANRGIPTSEFWPQKSVNRSNDNPATWENAALYKFTEWMDLSDSLMEDQLITCLLLGIPVVSDFNWWSHSVCTMDLVSATGEFAFGVMRSQFGKLLTVSEFDVIWSMNDPVFAGLGTRIWNSWADSWSDNGTGLLTGRKAIPDSALGARVMTLQ